MKRSNSIIKKVSAGFYFLFGCVYCLLTSLNKFKQSQAEKMKNKLETRIKKMTVVSNFVRKLQFFEIKSRKLFKIMGKHVR